MLLAGSGLAWPQERAQQAECCSVVARALEAVQRIQDRVSAGITRAELEKEFTTEGGLFTRTEQRYVYRDCRWIKIVVTFAPDSSPTKSPEVSPGDTVKTVSRPFLEYSIAD